MNDGTCVIIASVSGIVGPLLIWAGTGSILACMGGFLVVIASLLPWFNVRDIALQLDPEDRYRERKG